MLWHLQYLISQLNASDKVWNYVCNQFHCISWAMEAEGQLFQKWFKTVLDIWCCWLIILLDCFYFFSYLVYFNEAFCCFPVTLLIIDCHWLWFQLKIQVVALSQKSPRENVIKKRYCILTREITNRLKVFLTNWNNEAKILQRGTYSKKLHFKPSFSTIYKMLVLQECILTYSKDDDFRGNLKRTLQ